MNGTAMSYAVSRVDTLSEMGYNCKAITKRRKSMRINESCAKCLYDRQKKSTDNEEYLAEIRKILDEREENDCGPLLVHKFNQVRERYFGKEPSKYGEIKKQYNDLVLSMERELEAKAEASEDPLMTSLLYARLGNYIDFGAGGMHHVDRQEFISQFDDATFSESDMKTYDSFTAECAKAERFLLIADNCGEIVLDKLFLRQLKKRFPKISAEIMVRGGDAVNDATAEDALYVGADRVARVISSGSAVTGTVEDLLSQEALEALDSADVILAKGQGNYESLSKNGRHIFYTFLCKCDLFVARFGVPRLTGIFVEEK